MTKDAYDKLNRVKSELDELKKSYFKKIKEIDQQFLIRPTKESLNSLESNF